MLMQHASSHYARAVRRLVQAFKARREKDAQGSKRHTRISRRRRAISFMSAVANLGSLMSIAATSSSVPSPNRLCSFINLVDTVLTYIQYQAAPLH
jgi:hypothetical protein